MRAKMRNNEKFAIFLRCFWFKYDYNKLNVLFEGMIIFKRRFSKKNLRKNKQNVSPLLKFSNKHSKICFTSKKSTHCFSTRNKL